jgi:hypothetical protein
MELEFPNWASVHISKGVSDARVNEIPNLDTLVTTTGGEMGASWMEVNGCNPVFVSFTSHNVLLVVQVPNLPGAIISSCCYDLLFSMQGHSTDASRMSLNWLLSLHPLIEIIEVF